MSWTDKQSVKHIEKIRDLFKIDLFIETGTHVGINAEVQSKNFKAVFTCENNREYYNQALKRLNDINNVVVFQSNSPLFLKNVFDLIDVTKINKLPIIYLDAHFYDENRPKGKGKFVVLDELKTLKGKDCILIIHDFDNNLGHINYDDVSLDMKLLKKDLLKVNPNFKFYTNELSSCDILTIDEVTDMLGQGNITVDTYDDMVQNLKYTWSKPEKTYRGILYAVPKKISVEGLREIK